MNIDHRQVIPLEMDVGDITDDPRIIGSAAMAVGLIAKMVEEAGLELKDMEKVIRVMLRINDKVQITIKLQDVQGHA